MSYGIERLLKDSSSLEKMWVKAKELEKLDRLFKALIEDGFKNHCSLVRIEHEKMVVMIDKASWATKFHFAIPDILKVLKIHPEFKKLEKINYIIAKNFDIKKNRGRKKRVKLKLSKTSADLLRDVAKKNSSRYLSSALLRLAKNANRRKKS